MDLFQCSKFTLQSPLPCITYTVCSNFEGMCLQRKSWKGATKSLSPWLFFMLWDLWEQYSRRRSLKLLSWALERGMGQWNNRINCAEEAAQTHKTSQTLWPEQGGRVRWLTVCSWWQRHLQTNRQYCSNPSPTTICLSAETHHFLLVIGITNF